MLMGNMFLYLENSLREQLARIHVEVYGFIVSYLGFQTQSPGLWTLVSGKSLQQKEVSVAALQQRLGWDHR